MPVRRTRRIEMHLMVLTSAIWRRHRVFRRSVLWHPPFAFGLASVRHVRLPVIDSVVPVALHCRVAGLQALAIFSIRKISIPLHYSADPSIARRRPELRGPGEPHLATDLIERFVSPRPPFLQIRPPLLLQAHQPRFFEPDPSLVGLPLSQSALVFEPPSSLVLRVLASCVLRRWIGDFDWAGIFQDRISDHSWASLWWTLRRIAIRSRGAMRPLENLPPAVSRNLRVVVEVLPVDEPVPPVDSTGPHDHASRPRSIQDAF